MVTNVLVFRPPAENSARGEEESGTLSPSHPHTLTPPHPHTLTLPFFLHLLSLLSPSRLLYLPSLQPFSSLSPSPSSLPPSSSSLQLNEVMEKETYNTAREILERFDPSHPSLRAPNPASQNQERQQNTPRSGSGQSRVASIEIPTVATVESKLLN